MSARGHRFYYDGAATAAPHPDFVAAISHLELRAIVFARQIRLSASSRYSALPGVRQALQDCAAPVVAVAPIIGGKAVKGPTAKMMRELGLEVSAEAVAGQYERFARRLCCRSRDAALVARLAIPTVTTNALMVSLADREQLAKTVLSLADDLLQRPGSLGHLS